jgi:hypothetical protein
VPESKVELHAKVVFSPTKWFWNDQCMVFQLLPGTCLALHENEMEPEYVDRCGLPM